jgi:hypothetical protein
MDSKDFQLYLEEQRLVFKSIQDTLNGVNTAVTELAKAYEKPVDEVTVQGQVTVNTEKEVSISNFSSVETKIDASADTIAKAIAESKPVPIESITVSNIKDAKADSVSITNISDFTKAVEALTIGVLMKMEKIKPVVNIAKQDLVFPRNPKDAIAVRLSDGKSFYNAIAQAISAGGGSVPTINGAVPVVNPDGSNISGGGGGGGGTQYTEQTPSTGADTITMAGVVRNDSLGALASDNGDRTQLQVDELGLLKMKLFNTDPISVSGGLTDTELRATPVDTKESVGLVPLVYDTVQITSYNANNDPLVVEYRTGGASGTLVATLTMTYDGSNNITQVVRT